MRRLMILAPVLALAVSGANCAGDSSSSGSPTGPTSVVSESTTAAKGGGGKPGSGGGTTGGSGSISLPVMVTDVGTSGTSYGDRVTFTVSTTATAYPWVTVKCFQNGSMVSKESNGIFPTSLDQVFALGPTPNWQGGAASCTATLENWDGYSKNGSITTLASISFAAAG